MEQNLQELYTWVDSHSITRQKKNLNRDFSDAVPLAEILKCHFPRLVELHNYAPKNSRVKKVDNWATLNRKVLKKIDINLSSTEIDNLTNSVNGAIEDLLFKVKLKVEEKELAESTASEKKDGSSFAGDGSKKEQKMVPAFLLEQQAMELDIKNEAIEILNQKITHLEQIISMKEDRINELQQKIEDFMTKEKNHAGFFNRFLN